MDLHDRYVHIPTTDLSILELLETAFKDNPFPLLHRLIQHYGAEIIKNNLDVTKLETFRMLLCYEYQLTFNSQNKCARIVSNNLCFKTIENVLFLKKQPQNSTDLLILYDIILLYTVLYCDLKCIEQHLLNFQKSNIDFFASNESRIFYMKIIECFLESLRLRQFLYNIESNLLKHFSLLYSKDIILWLQIKENKEWRSFASIFPKLINTFGPDNILPSIWDFVLNKFEDLKDSLDALSIITDICFSLNYKEANTTYHNLCYSERLWLLIINSLKCPIQQYRKQALFIMKRITDFMSVVDKNVLKLEKPPIVPFICNRSDETDVSITNIKQKFFLILEALEEKQYHLIMPALTHVATLVRGNKEHVSCNDCFNNCWLQLLFERILKHENNIIVKQGILYVCELHTIIHDYQFLKLFVHVLNNTFLYECKSYQQEPEILNDIITLFIRVKEEQIEFIDKLLQIINNETWAPIPIFYMMLILRIVSSKSSNYWENNELTTVKFLVQKNLNAHSHILRIASQIELLNTISLSLKKINDLKIVIDVLSEFPPEEALIRGSYSWNIMTAWLSDVLIKTDVINFVKFICEENLYHNKQSRISPAKFALMICILHDANLILQCKMCPVEGILNKWLSSLNEIDTRPYANMAHIFYIIEVMSHLLNLNATNMNKSLVQLLSLYINDTLQFLLKNNKSIPYKFNYEEVKKHLTVIVSFLSNGNLILPQKEILNYIEKFRNESITILENIKQYSNVHYMYALYILHYTQSILNINPVSFYIQPLLNISYIRIRDNDQDQIHSKGKIASDCYLLLAKLTNQFLSKVEIESWLQKTDWFKNILDLYEVGGNEIVPEIALILKTIVEKGGINDPQNKLNVESIFTICWRSTLLSTKNKIYFMAMKNLIRVIINNNFLVLPDAINFVNHFLDQLIEESNNTPKLKKILLNEMKLLNICNLRNLQESLLLCLLHGHVFRRDEQVENQTYLYITKYYKNYYPQHISIIDHDNYTSIRVLSVVLLHEIISADIEYTSTFLPIVLQKLEKYKNKRYFNHSYIHKIKHRIMQILLILQPTLNKTDTATLQELLCSFMLLESNQHSVRLMQEWILIQIFVKYSEFHYKLWEFFEEMIVTRPGCVSSVACIVYHISKLLPNNSQSNFISTGIKYIARCCLGQQYNMRLYSQVIFVKLYEILEKLNCDRIVWEYKGLYNTVIESLKDGNLMKNSSKIQDDFYLSVFHPMQDYSLQTLYFELPRLMDMDQSEWIDPDLFRILNFKETRNHPLRLYNLNTLLSETETSSYLTKSTDSSRKYSEIHLQELSDIQKKINPSMSMTLSHNVIFPTIREFISQKTILSDEGGIIVVACLVDRIPNLGGLARTCEIFNVKELVLANLNQIKDREFQNLSVSAENWITITEIKPHQLSEYLLQKKDMGWWLVGVEQTANSTNLLNMKFKKQTILVLGNEKDGIPANLIPLFDTCIEIPQVGVIRSLNVHVSGAICIWQYAKQHTLT
ncbi:tRNA (guanosine(18)-2'-O)-methyltransferase TARBP1 isoform X1 [Colletes latitarsis]|uniref:tRNA (guanosine(18)-2'-O)-methyltransferase TARBP1 isoform X1 n=1 Tax=Colletes latitarsis TaxID=2605962 RepID=UPI0040364E58